MYNVPGRTGQSVSAETQLRIARECKNVFATKEASNAIAAASRIGQIMQSLSDQLYSAEIPTDVRTGEFAEDKIASYCDALTTIAEPISMRKAYRSVPCSWCSCRE